VVFISGWVNGGQNLTFDFSVQAPKKDTTIVPSALWLVSSAVLDSATTLTLVWHLMRSRTQTRTEYFNKLIVRIVILVWETALPPALCATIVCITHFWGSAVAFGLYIYVWSAGFMMVLGKLYALSYFITVNFRLDLEQERATESKSFQLKLSELSQRRSPPAPGVRVDTDVLKTTETSAFESGNDHTQSTIDPSPWTSKFGTSETV